MSATSLLIDDHLSMMEHAEIYIIRYKMANDIKLWMFALYSCLYGDTLLYYEDTESGARNRTTVLASQSFQDRNIISKHFIKKTTIPHVLGERGFHDVLMNTSGEGNDREFITWSLFDLEQNFLVPDGTYDDWKEILRIAYPRAERSDTTNPEKSLINAALARYPSNGPSAYRGQSPTSARHRSRTPTTQARPSSPSARRRSNTPCARGGSSSPPARHRSNTPAARGVSPSPSVRKRSEI